MKNKGLKEKIGQLFMVGVQDDEHLLEMIKDRHVGGVIYFTRNGKTAKEAYDWIAKAKHVAKTPLFIAVDEEGGIVSRIKSGITPISGAMALAATNCSENAFVTASIKGQALKALGFNMNFAPVVDINVNEKNPVIYVRSYGDLPEKVIAYAERTMAGYQTEGILPVLKHFPGHGDTSADSHVDLPIVHHDIKRLQEIELKPFEALMDQGSIMVSHVLFLNLDKDAPSTLSKNVVTTLLREKMEFQGLVLSDCMEMKAVSERYGYGKAAVLALKAGIDILLYSGNKEAQIKAMTAVMQAVESGELSEEIIDEKLMRIFKIKSCLDSKIFPWEVVEKKVAKSSDLIKSQAIAVKSMTWIGPKVAILKDARMCFPEDKDVRRYFPDALYYKSLEDILVESKRANQVVVAYKKRTTELIELCHTLGSHRIILVPLLSPYEMIKGFSGILTYECSEISMYALKEALKTGVFLGVCPVRSI